MYRKGNLKYASANFPTFAGSSLRTFTHVLVNGDEQGCLILSMSALISSKPSPDFLGSEWKGFMKWNEVKGAMERHFL